MGGAVTFASMDLELLSKPDEAAGEVLVNLGVSDLEHGCPRCKTLDGMPCKLDSGLYVADRVHLERRNEHDIPF